MTQQADTHLPAHPFAPADGGPAFRVTDCQVVMLDGEAMLRLSGSWESTARPPVTLECIGMEATDLLDPLPPGPIESDGAWSVSFALPEPTYRELALTTPAGRAALLPVPRRTVIGGAKARRDQPRENADEPLCSRCGGPVTPPEVAPGGTQVRKGGSRRSIFALGALAGVAAVPFALSLDPVERGSPGAGLDLTISTMATGELATSSRPIAARTAMNPDKPARGATLVRNQTGKTLAVRARASVSSRDVDDSVQIRLRLDGRPFYRGTLGGLRRWTPRSFVLRKGQRGRLEVEARVDGDTGTYRGRSADVVLHMRSRPRDD